MGVVDRFERAVSHGVKASFSKLSNSTIKDVDIITQIRNAMEDGKSELSGNRIVAPNEYTVLLNQSDYQNLQASNSQVLAEELAQEATRYAYEQNYVFVGPVEVVFHPDVQRNLGSLEVTSTIRRGPAAPVTSVGASPSHPIIDIEGQQWLLAEPVTVIGRGSEADIVVHDPGVSRRHLEIRITPTGVIATDLGSTNGSYVEGHRIDAATLVDANEITIGRTHIRFWTSNAEERY